MAGFTTPPRQGQLKGHLFPAPVCWNCRTITAIPGITEDNNPNGNAGRPYYKCPKCPGPRGFFTFADNRNVNPSNPLCWCGRYSRGELTSIAKGRRLFYKCWNLQCRFWEWADEQTTDNDASSSLPKAKSNEDFWSPGKFERIDGFRSPSAVEAERSHVFRSTLPVKAKASEVLLSPVEVKCNQVSPSPKKETMPLPAQDDFTEGLAGLTLTSSPPLEPKGSRPHRGSRSTRRWKLFLCC